MIIWSGHGYLVPVLGIASLVVTQLLTDLVMGGGYYTEHAWPKVVAGLIALVALWVVGNRLHAGVERRLVDPVTGEEVVLLPPSHTFFFIKVHHWAVVNLLLILGVLVYAALSGAV